MQSNYDLKYVLTKREYDILPLLCLDTSDILDILCVENSTFKTHLHNIYSKFKVTNRTAALMVALRNGLVDFDKILIEKEKYL